MSEELGYQGCAAFRKRKNKHEGIRDEEAGAGTTRAKRNRTMKQRKVLMIKAGMVTLGEG